MKGIPREAYYIATKVGRYELDYENMFNFSKEKTRKSFNKSLELLGLNYVDVIQVSIFNFLPISIFSFYLFYSLISKHFAGS